MAISCILTNGSRARMRHGSRRGGPSNLVSRRPFFERLEARQMLSLTHLYTFNNGTANDSIGSAHATLVHGASILSGWLTLRNISVDSGTGAITNITSGAATAQYLQFPSGVLPA